MIDRERRKVLALQVSKDIHEQLGIKVVSSKDCEGPTRGLEATGLWYNEWGELLEERLRSLEDRDGMDDD